MSVLSAIALGLRWTLRSPRIVLALWLVNLAVALPAAAVVSRSIERSIGPSLVHEKLRSGFDMGWYGEYEASARGIGRSFTPTVAGAGAFFDNLEGWVTGRMFREHPALVGVGLVYALLWAFLLGGVFDRFARPDAPREPGAFTRASGEYFLRFVRLGAFSGVLYVLIYLLHRWMFERLDYLTRDVTRERSVLVASLAVYLLTAFLLTLVNMSFDYAKIATVVEARRGMLLAALRGIGFVLADPLRTFAVYYGVLLFGAALLALYALLAPGAGPAGPPGVILALLAGQLFLLAKLLLRLTLLAAQTALYRGRGGERAVLEPPRAIAEEKA